MPIYEYHCDACEKNFECLILGSEQPECPSCNSKKVKKLISHAAFSVREAMVKQSSLLLPTQHAAGVPPPVVRPAITNGKNN